MSGNFIQHAECPECGSSDAFSIYEQEDGSYDGTCFSCKHWTLLDANWQPEVRQSMQTQQAYIQETVETIFQYDSLNLPDRGLRGDILKHYGTRVSVNVATGAPEAHYYPVYTNGQLAGYKKRHVATKSFMTIGNCKSPEFFGQWLFPGGGKTLVICEGEIDAMAAFQMSLDTDNKFHRGWRVASLPTGAPSAIDAVKRNLEWLESFDKVVICFDNDKPGQDATALVSELLSPGKAHIVNWASDDTSLDAGEMLVRNQIHDFMGLLINATPHTPSGIISGADTWAHLHDRPRVDSLPYPDHWELNAMTYGIRPGELDTWTSGSGSGKTQVMRELQFHILSATDANVGVIALEEPLHDTVEGLMALYLGKRIHLPDVDYTPEEYKAAWDFVAGTNRIHLYDHWGSTDADTLFNKIRYLARGLDCKYIFLDHLSIVVSEFAGDGDERRQIDTIMSKLKKLTQELQVWIGLVVHLRKTSSGASFEEGSVPTTDDLRGSGSIKQLSNGVYAIARNQQHPDEYLRNTSSVHSLKCRFTGRTGPAGWLHFHGESGRMIPVGDPEEELALRASAEETKAAWAAEQQGIA